ncbi:hypothetical protein M408DRAFT_28574 [Serendipita vermifera MAFF 305830]|uniref:F-box domain-containing protein n=1 Tax=Serendipita vermifera MAFF 305830 TaxID=933852 RepID=A0A0C3ATK8_SERVB|nr:hypothetical protein M408DRAFT_28574 [Serendipita vermifera MAFF 305830]
MRDPISALPPEVAWRCIFEALPFEGKSFKRIWYPSVLLQLMTVSHYWEVLILSTPSFWTQIHVRNSAQDLLSTLAVFLSLSRKKELELVIWDDPVDSHVQEFLLPHLPRVRVLTILTQHYQPSLHRLLLASSVMKDLILGPNLKELDLGDSDDRLFLHDSYDRNTPWLGDIHLTFSVKVASYIYGVFDGEEWHRIWPEQFAAVYTDSFLDDAVPALGFLTNLSALRLYEAEESPESADLKNVISTAPPHLKEIASSQPYCPNLRRLIVLTASRLSSLIIRITVSEISEVSGILPSLLELQDLSLEFRQIGHISDAPCIIPRTVIPCLQTLGFLVTISSGYDASFFDGIFLVFLALYPCVKVVRLWMSALPDLGVAYLQSLQRLERLSITDEDTFGRTDYRELFLPTLQELENVYSDPIPFIKAPNLISLQITSTEPFQTLYRLQSRKLQKLTISTSSERPTVLALWSTVLAEVKRLSILFHHANDRWTLTSLPLLASIRLSSASGINLQGNMLCAQLIYHPGMCPCLREIDFGRYVEWDLLFIMLKQRNLGRKDVARIEKVSVPFVPFEFRQSLLDLLLGRERQDGPSNMVLSLEETRELICDPSM